MRGELRLSCAAAKTSARQVLVWTVISKLIASGSFLAAIADVSIGATLKIGFKVSQHDGT